MKSYDNSRRVCGEVNNFRTGDGKSISTVTAYDPFGRPTSQSIATWEPNGKVSTTTTIGGKLLP